MKVEVKIIDEAGNIHQRFIYKTTKFMALV